MPLQGQAKAEYQLRWMLARRQEWLMANGPCAECKSWDDLEVDHIDPAAKKMNPAKLWSLSPFNPVRVEELAKCQVLCAPHHKAKTSAYLSALHSGVRASSASLTDETLVQVKLRLAAGMSGTAIASQLSISKFTVSRVKTGKAYSISGSSVGRALDC